MQSLWLTTYHHGRAVQCWVVYWIWMRTKLFSVWMALKAVYWSKCLAVQSEFRMGKHEEAWINGLFYLFSFGRDGFFAAASCMSFQQCRFNFGSEPFKYPPKSRSFDSFNSHAYLKEQDKIVLPRHLFLEQLRKLSVREDSCTLCFDLKGIVRLEPCMHRFETNRSIANATMSLIP